MYHKRVILLPFIIILLITECTRTDTLYSTPDEEPVRCHAFIGTTLHTLPSQSDDSAAFKIDTIQAGEKTVLCGIIEPSDATMKNVFWTTGESTKKYSGTVVKHTYKKPGRYIAFFTIEDNAGISIKDSVVCIVNTSPEVDITTPDTLIYVHDTLLFTAAAADSDGTITEQAWDFDGDGYFDLISRDSSTAAFCFHTPGIFNCICRIKDNLDGTGSDTVQVEVSIGQPVIASITADTVISIKDSIVFTVDVQEPNGIIAEYTWDFDADYTADFRSTKTSEAGFRFNDTGTYTPVFRAVDNDSLAVTDTVRIKVIKDPPDVSLKEECYAWVGDSVYLTASASDEFGYIAKWEWWTGDGEWHTSSDSDFAYLDTNRIEHTVICSCAVTDDDGNRTVAVQTVHFYLKVASVEAGLQHSLILRENGTLWACGRNKYGQIGRDSVGDHKVPVLIADSVKSMKGGYRHSLILRKDETLWGCGHNKWGTLGDGTKLRQLAPVLIQSDIADMTAGYNFSFSLSTDGTLWAFGSNTYGRFGDGTENGSSTPKQVYSDITATASGRWFSLILKNNGELWGCGDNRYGQLSDDNEEKHITPILIKEGVKKIAAGEMHSLILTTDGTLWACGDNDAGQLGDGTTTNRGNPVEIMSDVKTMSAGTSHSLILKNDETLWECGGNQKLTPVQIQTDVKSIAAGSNFSLLVKDDGTYWGCGSNYNGELGDGTKKPKDSFIQIIPPPHLPKNRK